MERFIHPGLSYHLLNHQAEKNRSFWNFTPERWSVFSWRNSWTSFLNSFMSLRRTESSVNAGSLRRTESSVNVGKGSSLEKYVFGVKEGDGETLTDIEWSIFSCSWNSCLVFRQNTNHDVKRFPRERSRDKRPKVLRRKKMKVHDLLTILEKSLPWGNPCSWTFFTCFFYLKNQHQLLWKMKTDLMT